MSAPLLVTGDARLVALAGIPIEAGAPPGATVVLGDGPLPEGRMAIRWHDGAPAGTERRIAPEGDGLWRRAPAPAADELFELAPAPRGAPVLVAGGGDAARADLIETIGRRGLEVREEPLLTRAGLESAGGVALLPSEAVPGRALALEAMAVLAARRLLLVPVAEVDFGLMPGIDHVRFRSAVEAADALESAGLHPRAFAAMRAWGAFAAGRHRASIAYAHLALDLALA